MITSCQDNTFTTAPLPIYGPFHALHLHSSANISKILGLGEKGLAETLQRHVPRIQIMSSTTGHCYGEKDTTSLLQTIVRDILIEPLQYHRALAGCVARALRYRGPSCLVIPFDPTETAADLATLIQDETQLDVQLRNFEELAITGYSEAMPLARAKLAIVGMSGRFPDAASHEKLWQLLEQGIDAHREVRFLIVLKIQSLTRTRYLQIGLM